MKRIAAALLAMLLAALPLAALAAVEDGFGYVEKFTLEDGTELPVKVERKTDWAYVRWGADETASELPAYTVTIPEGTQSVWIYLTEDGTEAFCGSNTYDALYSLVYDVDNDTTDNEGFGQPIQPDGEDHFIATVGELNRGYVMQRRDNCDAAAILMFEVGELPAPAQRISGDVNGDQTVTVDDAILILQHVAALNTLSDDALKAADMTGDGNADVNDAIAILKQIAGAN